MAFEWTIDIQESNGSWTTDVAIRRPQSNMEISMSSSQGKVALVDGSFAYFTPEIKYTKEPVAFTWVNDDGTLKAQLETYLINNEYLRITSHTGETFIGRITKLTRVWLTGLSPDVYDFQVSFERME